MMGGGNGSSALSVPPGFRFHPTDEELLYYYLKKKVSYEPIDFDVIREVDLNKLEPWDLKEKCRIGSGPQNEWYFFSHKDKKYPTGTRTNRATAAGFWKATGRDKAIHMSNSRRIGMRKTLVFYTGRAPHGHKTDWIMHEYRLDDDNNNNNNALPLPPREIQEDGWVICRVFKKKNLTRGFHADVEQLEETTMVPPFHAVGVGGCTLPPEPNNPKHYSSNVSFDSMHLPQLLSPESTSFLSSMDPHNLLRLTSSGAGGAGPSFVHHQDKISGDWSFLDKLLATHQSMDQITKFTHVGDLAAAAPGMQRFAFPFPYHGGLEHDFSKFPK